MAARKQRKPHRVGRSDAKQTADLSHPTTAIPAWLHWLPWLCVAAFLPAMAHNIAGWIAILKYPADANFGEGVLLYEGWRLANGKSIYLDPAQPPFWMATYPPLYQLLVAIGGAKSLLWPRMISLLASFVCAGSLVVILRRMGQSW